jgi:1-acyl-sn-glycerol-3-phosphate acyltransferase
MRAWHALEVHDVDHLPPHGPALVLLNHASLVDIPALLAIDPYPDTAMIAKGSLLRLPVLGALLLKWGAIPVERQGRDSAGVRALLRALADGRVVAVAAEGRRTRSGHLEAINPVLAKIAATADVPLCRWPSQAPSRLCRLGRSSRGGGRSSSALGQPSVWRAAPTPPARPSASRPRSRRCCRPSSGRNREPYPPGLRAPEPWASPTS